MLKIRFTSSWSVLLLGTLGFLYAQKAPKNRSQEPSVRSSSVVTCSIRPYQVLERLVTSNELQEIIKLPGGISKEHLKKASKLLCYRGIYATYAGQIDHSNCDGRITFSLKHAKPEFVVVIADHLYPLQYPGLTVQFLEVESPDKAKYYRYERTTSPLINKPVWRVSKMEEPKSAKIPLNAIVIFAHPEDILIIEGDYLAETGNSYVLPDIYVMPLAATAEQTARMITVNYLMAPVRGNTKRDGTRITRLI